MSFVEFGKEANKAELEFLSKTVETIETNLSDSSFGVAELASMMNMSRANLHVKLKTLTGKSAIDFINKTRFDKACRLLEEGKLTISQISDRVGLSSAAYFATAFKKHTGMTPSEYAARKR